MQGFQITLFSAILGVGKLPVSIHKPYIPYSLSIGDYVWYPGYLTCVLPPTRSVVGSFDCGWTYIILVGSAFGLENDGFTPGVFCFCMTGSSQGFWSCFVFCGRQKVPKRENRGGWKVLITMGTLKPGFLGNPFKKNSPKTWPYIILVFFTLKLSKLYEWSLNLFLSIEKGSEPPKKHRVNWKTVLNKCSLKWRKFDRNQPPEWGLFSWYVCNPPEN